MDNKQIIAEVLFRVISRINLSQMRNITAATEKTWAEMLNGGQSSQLAADRNLEAAIRSAVDELEDPAVNYISTAFK